MKKRVYEVTIYFQDSPNPLHLTDVWHIQTEGNLLRMIINGKSQWWPLVNIAFIKENSQETKDI